MANKSAGESKVRKMWKTAMDDGRQADALLISKVANLLDPSIRLGSSEGVADSSGVSLSGASDRESVDRGLWEMWESVIPDDSPSASRRDTDRAFRHGAELARQDREIAEAERINRAAGYDTLGYPGR